jgi:hypothetical protein
VGLAKLGPPYAYAGGATSNLLTLNEHNIGLNRRPLWRRPDAASIGERGGWLSVSLERFDAVPNRERPIRDSNGRMRTVRALVPSSVTTDATTGPAIWHADAGF